MIPVFVGFDPRETVCYHVFSHSVARRSSKVVGFTPLAQRCMPIDGKGDGSNDFNRSRFLVPHLSHFTGWALYADGDMVCKTDIAELWALRDQEKAVMVVQHDYKTKAAQKYLGSRNVDYPRKNWSSLMLWNCGHPANAGLTPDNIAAASSAYLHRFQWLPDSLIGDLPLEWGWLVGEYWHNADARLLHYTLGAPCFAEYAQCDHAEDWHNEVREMCRPADSATK